jgi:hypothetical protein
MAPVQDDRRPADESDTLVVYRLGRIYDRAEAAYKQRKEDLDTLRSRERSPYYVELRMDDEHWAVLDARLAELEGERDRAHADWHRAYTAAIARLMQRVAHESPLVQNAELQRLRSLKDIQLDQELAVFAAQLVAIEQAPPVADAVSPGLDELRQREDALYFKAYRQAPPDQRARFKLAPPAPINPDQIEAEQELRQVRAQIAQLERAAAQQRVRTDMSAIAARVSPLSAQQRAVEQDANRRAVEALREDRGDDDYQPSIALVAKERQMEPNALQKLLRRHPETNPADLHWSPPRTRR